MQIQLCDLHLPCYAVTTTSMLHDDGQISPIVVTTELRGRDASTPHGSSFGLRSNELLLGNVLRNRGPTCARAFGHGGVAGDGHGSGVDLQWRGWFLLGHFVLREVAETAMLHSRFVLVGVRVERLGLGPAQASLEVVVDDHI